MLQIARESGGVEYRTLHLVDCTEIRLCRGSYSEVVEGTSDSMPQGPPAKK